MARNTKPIYEAVVKVITHVQVSISADNVQEAVSVASNLKHSELVKPADNSCEVVDWEIEGLLWVQMPGQKPFKQ